MTSYLLSSPDLGSSVSCVCVSESEKRWRSKCDFNHLAVEHRLEDSVAPKFLDINFLLLMYQKHGWEGWGREKEEGGRGTERGPIILTRNLSSSTLNVSGTRGVTEPGPSFTWTRSHLLLLHRTLVYVTELLAPPFLNLIKETWMDGWVGGWRKGDGVI